MRILTLLAILLASSLCHGQMLEAIVGAAGGAPQFKQYTYVPGQSGTAVASITSPSIPIAATDFVYVSCRSGGTTTGITASSSGSFTSWTYPTGFSSANTGRLQPAFAQATASGSYTFTCTPSASAGYQSMVVLDYSQGNSNSLLASATGGPGPSGTASASFTTGARSLVVFCATIATTSDSFTAGTINGAAATIRGVSGSSVTGIADTACEDLVLSGSVTSSTANVNFSPGTPYWAASVSALSY